MNASTAPRPLYLHGSGTPVFAFLHPGAHPQSKTAVLMCPPFGWEDMCCYRIRRDWARELAQAGHTTLRIDLPGSGDSAGAPTDPGQLDAWTNAVTEAARWLLYADSPEANGADGSGVDGSGVDGLGADGRGADGSGVDGRGVDGRVDVERVAVIGIGLGGLVACRAALTGAPIEELALWSVPTKGKRLLRELRAFSAFEVANNPDEDEPDAHSGRVEDGTLATNGYMMSAETVSELERLDLARTEPAMAGLRRALVLGRDGMTINPDLPELLASAGAEVQVADGPGYGAMMQEPQDARTPSEVIERVDSWLREAERGSDAPKNLAVRATATVTATTTATGEMTIECAGAEVRERPVSLDGPDGQMFGVLSEPLGERRGLTAVLLNAGPQRRTGPNRMWVEIARRWASRGVTTLRLDCSGIGDSDGDPSVLARVTEFYRPVYAAQAQAAVQALAASGLPQRFVMVGLCAGAYWSVQTALADERVVRVIMLNPRTLVFDEWRHTRRRTRQLREKALRAETWGKVIRGEIKVARHIETGRTLLERAVGAPGRARARARIDAAVDRNEATSESPGPARHDPIEALFDELKDRGQRGLLLFTGKEVLRRELTDRGVLDRMDRWPNLELALRGASADTHTLTPLWLQREAHELVDRVLVDELGRLPAAEMTTETTAAQTTTAGAGTVGMTTAGTRTAGTGTARTTGTARGGV